MEPLGEHRRSHVTAGEPLEFTSSPTVFALSALCLWLKVVNIWAERCFASLYQFSSQARTRSLSQPHFSRSGNPAILTQITKLIICVYIWSARVENINHTLNDQGKVWRSGFCAAFELRFELFYSSPC